MKSPKYSIKAIHGLADKIAEYDKLKLQLDIVDGDSSTIGSFRKAISDVIDSAPDSLNTLKEIVDYIKVNPSIANISLLQSKISELQSKITITTTESTMILSIDQSTSIAKARFNKQIIEILEFSNVLITHPITNINYFLPAEKDPDDEYGIFISFFGYLEEFLDVTVDLIPVKIQITTPLII